MRAGEGSEKRDVVVEGNGDQGSKAEFADDSKSGC
jgi:hypothetical protein